MMWQRDAPADTDLRLVRPYALTRGRTRSEWSDLPIETLLVSTMRERNNVDVVESMMPEQHQIVALCITPRSVAEVSAHLHVPIGVARVLAGDLIGAGVVTAHRPSNDTRPDVNLLERVLHGLHTL
jgi:hypothetical protein